MKKYFMILAAMVGFACVTNDVAAQTTGGFQIHAGLALPVGNFSDGSSKNEPMVDGKGRAGTGFNVGVKGYIPVSVEGLFITLGADGYFNGMNSDYKDEREGDGDVDISFPWYINIPITAGICYRYSFNDAAAIYGEFNLGANISTMTSYKMSEGSMESALKVTPAIGFAYGIEAGVLLADRFNIGLRYNGLGSYKYKYTMEMDGEESDPEKFAKKLSISNFAIVVGIKF